MKINFFSAYTAQKPIIERLIKPFLGQIEYTVVNASRQSGKTLIAANISVYWALQESKQTIMIVSPVDSQVKKIYKQILNAIVQSGLIKSSKIQSGDSEIVFQNGSKILFRSAQSTNSLRGNTVNYLIIDEASFVDEETFTTILSPTLAVAGKKILFCSTPKGKNYFYKLFMSGLNQLDESGKPNYIKSFKTTYRENPYANMDFIEKQRLSIPAAVFSQEFEAEFIDSGSIFQNFEQYCVMTYQSGPIQGERYFIGIDLAFSQTGDYTIATVFNDKAEQVYSDRFREDSNEVLIQRLLKTINLFKPVKCLVESNNIGSSVISQLISRGVYNCEPFTTTSQSKSQLINEFAFDLNSGKIRLLNDEQLKREFGSFSFKMSPKGNVQFMASSGSHDDFVMSVLIAYFCMKQNRYYGELIFV